MDEGEWLACTDPDRMLRHLHVAGRDGDRKQRLFGCACCRRVEGLMTPGRGRAWLAVAEAYADGPADESACDRPMRGHYDLLSGRRADIEADLAAWYLLHFEVQMSSIAAAFGAAFAVGSAARARGDDERAARRAERGEPVLALRDIFGDPYRPAGLDPCCLTPTVVGLARSIYEGRAFERIPILGDALEDAGCDDADILAHCRGQGGHVRGCWAIDLLLGKA